MKHYASIFISDLHLGSPWCRAEELLDFLNSFTCDKLYLVGDILDNWHLQRKHPLPAPHLHVWERFLRLSEEIEVTYLVGNHDDFLHSGQPYHSLFKAAFANIRLCAEAIHTAPDGRRYLVTHGDVFDPALRIPGLSELAVFFYESARSLAGALPRSSPAKRVKAERIDAWLMRQQEFITRLFGNARGRMLATVNSRGLDGIICGHTHLADLRTLDGLVYANCGYWTGACHALLENAHGALSLLPWGRAHVQRPLPQPVLQQPDSATNSF